MEAYKINPPITEGWEVAKLIRVRAIPNTRFGNEAITFVFSLIGNGQEVIRTQNFSARSNSRHEINRWFKLMFGAKNLRSKKDNLFTACRNLELLAVGDLFHIHLRPSGKQKYPADIVDIRRSTYIKLETHVRNSI